VTELLSHLDAFLSRHDLTIDLLIVWTMAVGFYVYALVKFVSWGVLRSQADVTMVGVSLKHQKIAEAGLGLAMGTLYGMTLVAYYTGHSFGAWERVLLRGMVVFVMLLGGIFGLRFLYYLGRESRLTAPDDTSPFPPAPPDAAR